MNFKRVIVAFNIAIVSLSILSCASSGLTIVSTPIENIDTQPRKTKELTEKQEKSWAQLDLVSDTIPGMSVEKAYEQEIKNYSGKNIIVAVLDSGIDIEHEDLKAIIWNNKDEVAGNGIDDDKNGYVDDINGWNFLGDIVGENLEMTRLIKKYRTKFAGISASEIPSEDKADYNIYLKAKADFDDKVQQNKQDLNQYRNIQQQLNASYDAVSKALGKEVFTKEELKNFRTQSESLNQDKQFLIFIMNNVDEDLEKVRKEIKTDIEYFKNRMDTHFNLEKDFRAENLGDDPDDMSSKYYGNNEVSGPDSLKKDATHGTHVAGIIAAVRNNELGMKGVADNVTIMPIRAVPDGDEYDKDIALGIRYAVDNGAKVINTSFGKYYSPHPDWVIDAIKYAANNDVLIVNASGNERLNLDENRVYPNDEWPGQDEEIADNFINVGASTPEYGSKMIADFSNYGKESVDIFAPGYNIYSTVPNNKYEYLSGTSMAAPNVTGVAAVIRSLFPKLNAAEVKKVILQSGLPLKTNVIVGGNPGNVQPFSEISETGRMVNLFNAIIFASKLSKS